MHCRLARPEPRARILPRLIVLCGRTVACDLRWRMRPRGRTGCRIFRRASSGWSRPTAGRASAPDDPSTETPSAGGAGSSGLALLFVARRGRPAVRRTVAARLSRVCARDAPDWSILVQLRLSRTLLGLFAGAALALGGCVFQAMLRDALATPYTLGVSTGASLGAVIAIGLGWDASAACPPSGLAPSPAPRACCSSCSAPRCASGRSRLLACCSPAWRPTASVRR